MQPDRPLRWLYLDLDSFFASVEQQLDPRLRGRPVAVGPGAIDSGTVIAASYEAKAFGVRTGMRVGEAKRRCPGLLFAGGSHRRYTEFHEAIVAEIGRHVPVTHVCSIDEVACRLLDNENGRDRAEALARRLKAAIRERVGECLTASVGIAPSRLLAKIAADMGKPDGLRVIEAAELPEALHPLAVGAIPGIGRSTRERLAARGITTMAQLLARPPGDAMGRRMWFALHGADFADAPRKSRSIGHSHVLAPKERSADEARATARRLLLKAGVRLRRAGLQTRHVTLHVGVEAGRRWSATRMVGATDDSFALLAALDGLLPRIAGRVRLVGVSLDDVRAAEPMLPFDGPQRSGRVWQALDAVEARFGPGAATLGVPAADRAHGIGSRIAFGRIPETADFGPVAKRNPRAMAVGC